MNPNYFRYAYERSCVTKQNPEGRCGIILLNGKKTNLFSEYEDPDYNPLDDCISKIKSKDSYLGDSGIYINGHLHDGENDIEKLKALRINSYILGDRTYDIAPNVHVISKEDAGYTDTNQWWTDEFYDKAYDIVKDRKFPITIPGYNRPSLPILRNLKVDTFTEECNWPFIVIVRESQRQMYEDATVKYGKYVTIKSFPDEMINNAGAVRRTTQGWLNSMGVKATFQMDDDVQYIGYNRSGFKENGQPKSRYRSMNKDPFEIPKIFAMWQIAMEKAMAIDDVFISCGQQIAFSWKMDYCESMESYRLMRGPLTQVVCFNIERLCQEGIYHKNNADVGFDDIDFTLRVTEAGHKTCLFPWLVYGCEALGGGNGDVVSDEKLKARFKKNQDTLREIHYEKPYVGFRVKRDLDQVCINWRGARRYYARLNGLDESDFINHSQYDLWNGGKVLDEAKSNKYNQWR